MGQGVVGPVEVIAPDPVFYISGEFLDEVSVKAPFIGRDEDGIMSADDVVLGPAGQALGLMVAVDEHVLFHVHQEDGVVGMIEDVAVEFFGLGQFPMRPDDVTGGSGTVLSAAIGYVGGATAFVRLGRRHALPGPNS